MKLSGTAVLLMLLATNPMIADDPESQIPGRFIPKWGGRAIWISASEALNQDGSVRQGVLHQNDLRELHRRRDWLRDRRQRGISTQGVPRDCDVNFVGYVSQGGESQVNSFDQLRDLARTRTVIRGTVVASDVGIHSGMPHAILRVNSDAAGIVYLIYPHARLRMNGMLVCNADPYYAEPPAIGASITAIVSQPLDQTGTLYWPSGWSIFYERDGVVVAAPFIRDDVALHRFQSLDDLTSALRGAEPPHQSHRQ